MKITAVQLTPIAVKRTNGFVSRHVIVEIQTDGGLRGIGEMSDFGHLPAYMPNIPDLARTLNALLTGHNPLQPAKLEQSLLELFPESNLIYDMGAVIRAGISIALHDLCGQWLGCPVHLLLGGAERSSVPIAYPIFRQSHERDVERNLSLAGKMREAGFAAFHVYVGLNPTLEIEFIQQLRQTHGSALQISVDGSNLSDGRQSLRIEKALRPHGIAYYESPALRNDEEDLAAFRRKADVPVSEHVYAMRQAERLLSGDCLDILNLTVIFAGGLRSAVKLLHAAEVYRKALVVGTTQELAIGSAAQAHFASVISAPLYPSHITGPLLYAGDVASVPSSYRSGELAVPAGDGIGVELDALKLEGFREDLIWEDVSLSAILHRQEMPSTDKKRDDPGQEGKEG